MTAMQWVPLCASQSIVYDATQAHHVVMRCKQWDQISLFHLWCPSNRLNFMVSIKTLMKNEMVNLQSPTSHCHYFLNEKQFIQDKLDVLLKTSIVWNKKKFFSKAFLFWVTSTQMSQTLRFTRNESVTIPTRNLSALDPVASLPAPLHLSLFVALVFAQCSDSWLWRLLFKIICCSNSKRNINLQSWCLRVGKCLWNFQ